MKKLCNITLGIVIFLTVVIVGSCFFYNYQLTPVLKTDDIIALEIPNNTTTRGIATILKEHKLIRDEKIFLIYVKLMKVNNMKAGYYDIPANTGVKKIVSILQEGSKKNPNEIQITFQEGIHMRDVANLISKYTVNDYDSVLEKTKDKDYLSSLIEKYWFIGPEVLQDEIYYGLEGYLFPDTYRFTDQFVSIEYIFEKMLDRMNEILTPYREDIEKSSYSVHQILTLASMVEKESANQDQRDHVASVFYNRIQRGMSLGSDVTTRYALKIDNNKQALSSSQFQTQSPYNTRLTNGTMNGKLPIGPISTVSVSSIKAAIYPMKSNDLYFIANIKTLETFFFDNSTDFERKKNELATVNGGL